MDPKIKKIFLILTIVLLAILVLLLVITSKQTKPSPTSIVPTISGGVPVISRGQSLTPTIKGKAPIKLKGREIAAKTRKFIEGLKTGVGDYTTDVSCVRGQTATGNCQASEVKSYIPGMIVSMYQEFYQKTNDQKDLESANKIMAELMIKCQQDVSFCEMIFFPLFGFYQQTKDQQYLTPMKQVADGFLALSKDEEATEAVNTYSLRIKKLLMTYSATADNRYLDKARARLTNLNEAANDNETNPIIYQQGSYAFRKYDCQQHWTVDYQFYQSTGVKNNLDDLADFIKKSDLTNNYQKINDIVPLVTCGEALLSLYKETANKDYLDITKLLLTHAVKDFYDGDLSPKFNGDNGFVFDNASVGTNNQANSKTLTENIWMVRNLIKGAWDEVFEL